MRPNNLINRRKKQEEEEDLEVFLKKSSLRDLKGENRKKREVVDKSWGKRERYFVILVFLATSSAAFVLALSSRKWKAPNVPRVTNDFMKDTVYLGEKKVDTKPIEAKLSSMTNGLSGVYSVYVINLSDGVSYGINENEVMQAASLVKLPVMFRALVLSYERELSLLTQYTLNEADKIGGAGSLYYAENGSTYSYRDLLKLMGKQSDNTAFGVMLRVVGEGDVSNFISSLGMKNTSISKNLTSAYDMSILFDKVWDAKLFSDAEKDELLDYITNTSFEDFLPLHLPDDVRVAHKYGRELHVVNDCGIVYAEKPYVVCILSEGVVDSEANEVIPEISRSVYSFEISR